MICWNFIRVYHFILCIFLTFIQCIKHWQSLRNTICYCPFKQLWSERIDFFCCFFGGRFFCCFIISFLNFWFYMNYLRFWEFLFLKFIFIENNWSNLFTYSNYTKNLSNMFFDGEELIHLSRLHAIILFEILIKKTCYNYVFLICSNLVNFGF